MDKKEIWKRIKCFPLYEVSNMKPYYQDNHSTIYHGDCREIISSGQLPETDLVIYDPPFNEWGGAIDIKSKQKICFTTFQHRHHIEKLFGIPHWELIWFFEDGRWVSRTGPRVTHENILVYGNMGPADVGDPHPEAKIGKAQKKGKSSIGSDTSLGNRVYIPKARKHLNSVLKVPRNMRNPFGAWGKPLSLMTTLLEWSASSTVLDPFLGSGTTLKASRDLGLRHAIGIEVAEKNCELAVKRLLS